MTLAKISLQCILKSDQKLLYTKKVYFGKKGIVFFIILGEGVGRREGDLSPLSSPLNPPMNLLTQLANHLLTLIYFSNRKLQKQPPEMFCKKGVFRNFAKFTGKHLCQSHFCLHIKKETLAQVLSCEFYEISKNTFLYRTPLVAVS